MLREIPGPVGRLEALLDEPSQGQTDPWGQTPTVNRGLTPTSTAAAGPRAAVIFAHPHPLQGGTMHTKVVYQSAKAFARIGCPVLRFNFRGTGSSAGSFDEGTGEQDDFRAALDYMSERYPGVPIWAAGMSFGSWVALTVGAEDPRVSALIGVAVPVTRYDFERVRTSAKPKFFIHGERDEIGSLKDIRSFYARAEDPKELVVIDAADHVFDGKVSEVADAIEDLFCDWPTLSP